MRHNRFTSQSGRGILSRKKVVMKKENSRIALLLGSPRHKALWVFGLACVIFLFTLFSFTLSHKPSQLSPIWFPSAIMMAAFYRFPGALWPAIALAGIAGIVGATSLYSPTITLLYPLTNVAEALIGALLMRRWLTREDPLQTLQDWTRMAIASALIPSLLGGMLIGGLAPEGTKWQSLLVWVLSEATGALALVPLGLLLNAQFCKRYRRNPGELLPFLLTAAVTLILSVLSLLYLPWPFTCIMVLLMWSAVRQPRCEAFLIFLVTIMTVLTLTTQHPQVLHMIENTLNGYALNDLPGLPFLMVLLPTGVMSIAIHAVESERRRIIESETRFRNAMEYSAIGMAVVDTHGQWLQVNKALSSFLGYHQDELYQMTIQQVTWHEDLPKELDKLNQLLNGDIDTYTLEKRYCTRRGDIVWALLVVSLVRNDDGTPLYFIKQIEDIDDLKKSREANKQLMARITLANDALFQEKERLHITLKSIHEAVVSTDNQQNIIFMNPVAEKMSGWTQAQAQGKPLLQVLHITYENDGFVINGLQQEDNHGDNSEQDQVLRNRHGDRFDIHYTMTPLNTQEGVRIGFVLVIQDVTESRKLLRQLSYNATHDALTRLPNRSNFESQLKGLLKLLPGSHQSHALVMLDLDFFKAVNDSAGHAAGDALLYEIAILMRSLLRPSDILARLGGDEFGFILRHCTTEQALHATQRVVDAINHYEFTWAGRAHRVGASAGLTMIHEHNAHLAQALVQADAACYASKHDGRGIVTVYTLNAHSGDQA